MIYLYLYSLAIFWCLGSVSEKNDNALVIENVNLISMKNDEVLKNQDILVSNGIISDIGPGGTIRKPAGSTVINAQGQYLIPALFDMHAHFFYEQGDHVNTCEAELKLMLAKGLGTVRIQCGDSVYLEARKNVDEGRWIGPDMYVSSPQFTGSWPWPGRVFGAVCKTPEGATEAVRRYKNDGYDEIKITFMVKPDVYRAITATAAKAGMHVTGHVGPLVKLPAALDQKVQIEHMDEFIDILLPDSSFNHGQSVSDMNIWRAAAWATVPFLDEIKILALVSMVKSAGIFVTPTNHFFISCFGDSISRKRIESLPEYSFIPEKIREERWKIRSHYWKRAPSADKREKYISIRRKMVYELWKGGVKLMAGSDSPEWFLVQGFSIHDELQAFVDAGLSPFAALEAATVNPATYLKQIKKRGTIEKGKEAALIILGGNPLEDIRNTKNISGVVNRGIYYDSKKLNALLEQSKKALNN